MAKPIAFTTEQTPKVETFITHALRGEGFDASEDSTGRGTPLVPVQVDQPIAFDCKGTEVQFSTDGIHPTLRSMGHSNSHQNAGGHAVVAFDTTQVTSPGNFSNPKAGDPCHPLTAAGHAPAIATQWAARRLMPVECEILQGFPPGFTAIPYKRRKIPADEAEQSALGGAQVWQEDHQWFTDCMADGPRYKMIGNSQAVPCIRWILERVEDQFARAEAERTAA